MRISFVLNGAEMHLDVAADRRVVDLFREDLRLTGTKEGCGTGECGACTILVDGQSRLSCLMLAGQLAGARVTTIEGIALSAEKLHPVQQSFVEHGAVQCGFCTPGMVITATEFLTRQPHSCRRDMAEAISGNLCRCTGYHKILDAMEDVAAEDLNPGNLQAPKPPAVQPLPPTAAAEKMPVFFPKTLDELWPLFSKHQKARVFAGGTDLLIWLRSGRIQPSALISLEKIEALRGISETPDEVQIGAGTCHAELLQNSHILRFFPALTTALKTLGSPHIRRMGTIGGNIVTASPAGDTLPPLHVLGAEIELCSATGIRRMPLADFILGPGKTALKTGEILSTIFLPKHAGSLRQHFEKVGLRSAMACAVASFAAAIGVSASGRVESARMAWGSVGPTVMTIPAAEAALIGSTLCRETFEHLVPLVRTGISPLDDVRASAAYRRLVAGNLLFRLLQTDANGSDATAEDKRTEENS